MVNLVLTRQSSRINHLLTYLNWCTLSYMDLYASAQTCTEVFFNFFISFGKENLSSQVQETGCIIQQVLTRARFHELAIRYCLGMFRESM